MKTTKTNEELRKMGYVVMAKTYKIVKAETIDSLINEYSLSDLNYQYEDLRNDVWAHQDSISDLWSDVRDALLFGKPEKALAIIDSSGKTGTRISNVRSNIAKMLLRAQAMKEIERRC